MNKKWHRYYKLTSFRKVHPILELALEFVDSPVLATLRDLGVAYTFSRAYVSDDNAYSEALFKTLKYCPLYPTKPFENLDAAKEWVEKFVTWYNTIHLHSGIKFVTPNDRHNGKDVRNWDLINEVKLNPLRSKEKEDKKVAA